MNAVREVDGAVTAVERAIRGVQAPPSGIVRVTSTDTFCIAVLPGVISGFHSQEGAIQIELIATSEYLDLSRLGADIAVRPTPELDPELEGKVVAELGFDVFAAAGVPKDRWLAPTGTLTRSVVSGWMTDNVSASMIAGSADSFLSLRELAAAGIGQVILPTILGKSDPRLSRRRGLLPDFTVNIWVVCHPDLAGVPRIREVRRMLAAALSADADRLAGRL